LPFVCRKVSRPKFLELSGLWLPIPASSCKRSWPSGSQFPQLLVSSFPPSRNQVTPCLFLFKYFGVGNSSSFPSLLHFVFFLTDRLIAVRRFPFPQPTNSTVLWFTALVTWFRGNFPTFAAAPFYDRNFPPPCGLHANVSPRLSLRKTPPSPWWNLPHWFPPSDSGGPSPSFTIKFLFLEGARSPPVIRSGGAPASPRCVAFFWLAPFLQNLCPPPRLPINFFSPLFGFRVGMNIYLDLFWVVVAGPPPIVGAFPFSPMDFSSFVDFGDLVQHVGPPKFLLRNSLRSLFPIPLFFSCKITPVFLWLV